MSQDNNEITARLERIEGILVKMERSLAEHRSEEHANGTRIGGLETRFGVLETRFGGLETRFANMENLARSNHDELMTALTNRPVA